MAHVIRYNWKKDRFRSTDDDNGTNALIHNKYFE